MTADAPPTGGWLTAQEVSQETGLRPDLVVRFVPHTDGPSGPLYNTQNLAAAHRVKQLTDAGAPAEAIDAAVRDITTRDGLAAAVQGQPTSPRRGKILAAAGAAAAVALIIGGVIGGLIGYNNRGTTPTAAPVTVTAEVEPPLPTFAVNVDPVCDEWGVLNDDYRGKRAEWTGTDSNVPASQWTPEQRQITLDVVAVLKANAAELRHLAEQADDPALRTLLGLNATYKERFAQRLPSYTPATDKPIWTAAVNFGNAVNSYCNATR